MTVSKQVFGSIMGATIGFVMSIIMSFFMLLVSIGFIEGFFLIWLKSAALGFAIAVPIGMVVAPLMERLLQRLFRVQA